MVAWVLHKKKVNDNWNLSPQQQSVTRWLQKERRRAQKMTRTVLLVLSCIGVILAMPQDQDSSSLTSSAGKLLAGLIKSASPDQLQSIISALHLPKADEKSSSGSGGSSGGFVETGTKYLQDHPEIIPLLIKSFMSSGDLSSSSSSNSNSNNSTTTTTTTTERSVIGSLFSSLIKKGSGSSSSSSSSDDSLQSTLLKALAKKSLGLN